MNIVSLSFDILNNRHRDQLIIKRVYHLGFKHPSLWRMSQSMLEPCAKAKIDTGIRQYDELRMNIMSL